MPTLPPPIGWTSCYCIAHALPLLFSDRDFQPFVDHLGLRAA